MKLLGPPNSRMLVVYVALAFCADRNEAALCESLENSACKLEPGCDWYSETCVVRAATRCTDRDGGSCENGDGQCIKVKGDCQAVNGDRTWNQTCLASLTVDSDGDLIYAEVAGSGCVAGYVCNVANNSDADQVDTNLVGSCQPEECIGKKVPGNCNGNNPKDPDCISETERVTICHRTCSAKNPWVRITIDEDAWDGEGCGHRLHDVRDECKNKAPWSEWGVNRRDYLIKRHGTRAQVAATRTTAEVKAYWKKWEPACPYVRNGACCDWDDPENPCCGDRDDTVAPTPAPTEKEECPFVTLDFTNLINPMADYYGQSSTFQAGDYLYDQLWWSHGVKVSARILSDSHADDATPYIPKFVRGSGWVDDKLNQKMADPTSGGAVRLFDTMRPAYSSNPAFNQPLCPNNSGEGDPDLGAPNAQCPGGGPGIGGGGIPFDLDTNKANPFANCEPLGLVCIIQEEDKNCPDDTGKGGFITFTFREPTEVALTSLLDIDEGPNTPKVYIYHKGGKATLNTQATGDNGLYPLDIDTSLYRNVTMVDVKYWGSGSIESLKYRYCPQTPTPQIQIVKYAGPPGFCTATGVVSNMQDDLYMVPSLTSNWTYCFEISIPASSGECLYDVQMKDPAPIGGTSDFIDVTTLSQVLCPGDKIYIQSPSILPGSSAPEGPHNATVIGTGWYSGQKVTDQDPAQVSFYHPAIEILKYAGPPGTCATPQMDLQQDDLYMTDDSKMFEYCYVITNIGNECLTSVSMIDDPLASGGIHSETPVVASESSNLLFCPGEVVTLVGPTPSISGPNGEPFVPAIATGTGEHSNQVVTSQDSAQVMVPPESPSTSAPSLPPSPAPTATLVCLDMDLPNLGSEYCPSNGVVPVQVRGTNATEFDVDILWGIQSDGVSVQFKVQNPFEASTRLFVQYHQPNEDGGWRMACDEYSLATCGATTLEAITADCLHGDGSHPFSLIQLYFVDDTNLFKYIFGPVQVDRCCHAGDPPLTSVAQYSFLLKCSCPTDERRSLLRGRFIRNEMAATVALAYPPRP